MSLLTYGAVSRAAVRNNVTEKIDVSRRSLVTAGLATASLTIFIPNLIRKANAAAGPARTLSLCNLHTGEKCRATYWEDGSYIPGALDEINSVLRDFRTGDVFAMDRELLNLMHAVQKKIGGTGNFEIISGYRSPHTNAMLRQTGGGGVAKKSLHMQGKAIDIKLPGHSLESIRDAAVSLGRGGVGYYSGQFVHIDTGRPRAWRG